MDTYLTQLLELIEEAITKAPCKKPDCEDEALHSVSFAREFLQSRAEKISVVTGIEKINFPSPDQLNAAQTKNIVQALEELLEAYNWEFMFPEQLNESSKYKFIRDHWDTKHQFCKEGMTQIETCTFDENKCPFPGQCKVCNSFKTDDDNSHHLCKGQIDFTCLMPEIQKDEEELRDDVNRMKTLICKPLNKSNITGIYNYCDGRCEKCAFTQQCSSYALNKQFDMEKCYEDDGIKQLKVFFRATTELIEEELNKKGINIDEIIEQIEEDDIPTPTPKHKLEKQAESYAEKVNRWFESNQMEIESRIVTEQGNDLKDDFETITWFQLFIAAKVNRAINGERRQKQMDGDRQDTLGSAKIALIAIDECIQAWNNLLNTISSKEDSILGILRHLSRLREDLESYFPEARAFIRPGLDE